VLEWAQEPLSELKFLRRIVERCPQDGDGFTPENAEKMKGCVVYAPFHLPPRLFNAYMVLAREIAGPELWRRVKGWRYLLQGKGEGVVAKMLEEDEESWVQNLCSLKGLGEGCRAWCFDVGVDNHRDGVGPMEAVGRLIRKIRKREEDEGHEVRVRFVLSMCLFACLFFFPGACIAGLTWLVDHLAKPPLTPGSPEPSASWLSTMTTLSSDEAVYMKLSGAFNEFTVEPTPSDIPTLLAALAPFLEHVFRCFPGRVMFGSDWPVCNVGGPAGEEGNWKLWREVVERWMNEKGFGEEEKKSVWRGAGEEAYGVTL
jgi:L-rhamnono-1,4-lactonase